MEALMEMKTSVRLEEILCSIVIFCAHHVPCDIYMAFNEPVYVNIYVIRHNCLRWTGDLFFSYDFHF